MEKIKSIETLTVLEVQKLIEELLGEDVDIFSICYDTEHTNICDPCSPQKVVIKCQEFSCFLDLGGIQYYLFFLWDFTNECIYSWGMGKEYEYEGDLENPRNILRVGRKDKNKRLVELWKK